MSRAAIYFLVIVTLGMAILLAWLGWATLRFNLLGWFLLSTGLAYFLGVIVFYWVRRVPFWGPRVGGEVLHQEKNDASFWFIVLGMIAAFYLPPIEYLSSNGILARNAWMQISGLLLIVLGTGLFIWARRTLGNFYSAHISVVQGQLLVMHGPYRFLRHPAYAGYLLIAFGLSIGYSSVAGMVVILGLLFPSIVYRIQIEDGVLAEHFGDQFSNYERVTKRLLPFVW